MNKIVDPTTVSADETSPVSELDEVNEKDSEESVQAQAPEVPEKFKGKSVEDIVNSYQNLERDYGRQGRELGELRKIADQILTQQAEASSSAKEKISTEDFYEDPEKYITRILEKKLSPITEKLSQTDLQSTMTKLDQAHPSWRTEAQSNEFQNWVASSPIRVDLFKRADNGDYTAAHELFDNWSIVNQAQANAKQAADTDRKEKLKAAKTERGSTGQTSKKVFRRLDLMNLRNRDPDRYDSMQDEIMRAYKEGRVR